MNRIYHTLIVFFVSIFLFTCITPKKIIEQNHFPTTQVSPPTLPTKENFHIYILAGQSNMAGRGYVQASDTIISSRILSLNEKNQWVFAKEPLHYYEPARTGLDCGLSFGKKLIKSLNKDITIGIVPCAIGGSSIEQWLYDSTYRSVTLYTNLMNKVSAASEKGVIKGIMWHQGESNAGEKNYTSFKSRLKAFILKLRKDMGISDLPFYAGMLGSFLKIKEFPNAINVNNDIRSLALELPNMYIIETKDLTPKSDTIHFDTQSQRKMGIRFANEVLKRHKK